MTEECTIPLAQSLTYVGRAVRSQANGKPEWCGDCFMFAEGGIYVPLTEESIAATVIDQVMTPHEPKVQTLVYDYESARRILSCSAKASYDASPRLNTPDLVLGDPVSLAREERDHLLYLRLDDQLDPRQTPENVVFLNQLTARGVALPQVIDGGAVYTRSNGYEGDIRLVRKDRIWDSYFVCSGSLRGKDSVWRGAQLAIHMSAYLGSLGGCTLDRSFVPPVVTNALLCREVQACLSNPEEETNYVFPHPHTIGPFHLAAVLCARKTTSETGPGILLTRWTEESALCGPSWYDDNLFIPYEVRRGSDGLIETTLCTHRSQRLYLDEKARFLSARSLAFDDSLVPLLQACAENKTPTLAKPYRINIQLG